MKTYLGLMSLVVGLGSGGPAPVADGLPTHEELQTMFRAIDQTGNRALDAREWREASEQMFASADVERINMTELRTILGGAFVLLDANADGVLSVEETPFLAPRHRAEMDVENRGRISLEQMINGYRWLLGADTHNHNRPWHDVG
jgi:hypothetical protein